MSIDNWYIMIRVLVNSNPLTFRLVIALYECLDDLNDFRMWSVKISYHGSYTS